MTANPRNDADATAEFDLDATAQFHLDDERAPRNDGAAGPGAGRRIKRVRRPRPLWLRNTMRMVAAALTVLLVLTVVSIGRALTAPGTDSTAARLAEWARDHGMSALVTWAENQQYQRNQPKVGGT